MQAMGRHGRVVSRRASYSPRVDDVGSNPTKIGTNLDLRGKRWEKLKAAEGVKQL